MAAAAPSRGLRGLFSPQTSAFRALGYIPPRMLLDEDTRGGMGGGGEREGHWTNDGDRVSMYSQCTKSVSTTPKTTPSHLKISSLFSRAPRAPSLRQRVSDTIEST